MKAAAAVLVAVGALFWYFHQDSGSQALPGYKESEYEAAPPNTFLKDTRGSKVTPRELERWVLQDEHRRGWRGARPHIRCARAKTRRWDFICTDSVTAWGYNVDATGVTERVALKSRSGPVIP